MTEGFLYHRRFNQAREINQATLLLECVKARIGSMTNEELIQQARAVVNPRKIAHGFTVGDVGCALLTEKGNLHLGVCIDAGGGIGFLC